MASLSAGDRVVVFTESVPLAQVRARLQARGILPGREGRAEQVQVLSAREAYLPTGRFEPARLIESLLGHVERATLDGFSGLRLVGDMSWALSAPAGVEQLAGYEAQVNRLYMDARALGVCVYTGISSKVACLSRSPARTRDPRNGGGGLGAAAAHPSY